MRLITECCECGEEIDPDYDGTPCPYCYGILCGECNRKHLEREELTLEIRY